MGDLTVKFIIKSKYLFNYLNKLHEAFMLERYNAIENSIKEIVSSIQTFANSR